MSKIKNCPFCGGAATVGANEYYDGANTFYIYCASCGVRQTTTKIRTDEAITAWNCRAQESEPHSNEPLTLFGRERHEGGGMINERGSSMNTPMNIAELVQILQKANDALLQGAYEVMRALDDVREEERRFYGKEFEQMIVKTYPKDEFRPTIWNIGEENEK